MRWCEACPCEAPCDVPSCSEPTQSRHHPLVISPQAGPRLISFPREAEKKGKDWIPN